MMPSRSPVRVVSLRAIVAQRNKSLSNNTLFSLLFSTLPFYLFQGALSRLSVVICGRAIGCLQQVSRKYVTHVYDFSHCVWAQAKASSDGATKLLACGRVMQEEGRGVKWLLQNAGPFARHDDHPLCL
jgi:hypothetical protein